jgi:Zn finger protein HypA/HybF involved in hydrogenase expression
MKAKKIIKLIEQLLGILEAYKFRCDNCGHTLTSDLSIYRSMCPKCGMGVMKKEPVGQQK